MDLEKVVMTIISPLVIDRDSVEISVEESGKLKTVKIKTNRRDAGNIIGHRGTIVNAIREVISIGAKLERSIVRIDVVSDEKN